MALKHPFCQKDITSVYSFIWHIVASLVRSTSLAYTTRWPLHWDSMTLCTLQDPRSSLIVFHPAPKTTPSPDQGHWNWLGRGLEIETLHFWFISSRGCDRWQAFVDFLSIRSVWGHNGFWKKPVVDFWKEKNCRKIKGFLYWRLHIFRVGEGFWH